MYQILYLIAWRGYSEIFNYNNTFVAFREWDYQVEQRRDYLL